MSSKRFLICSTAQWASLTAPEQALYENHYETLILFLAAKDSTTDLSGDDYILEHLGSSYEETITSRQKVHINLSGGKLIFSALGKWIINDNYASNYIFNLSDNGYCPVIFNNVTFKALANKTNTFRGFIMTDHDRYVELYNCTFDMNNKNCGSIVFMSDNAEQRHVVYRCIFKNSGAGTDVGGINVRHLYSGNGVHWIVNCIFINIKYAIFNTPSGVDPIVNYYNNYFDTTVGNVNGPATHNFDLGGNVSSSEVSLDNAFVDHENLDYTSTDLLKVGVASQIPEDTGSTYAGAFPPSDFTTLLNVGKKRKKHRTKLLVLGF